MGVTVAVAMGGALGALARYGVARAALLLGAPGVLAIFMVNSTGAFALGLLVGLVEQRLQLAPALRVGLGVGVLGSFTTFSTLVYDVVARTESGAWLQAGLNLGGSLLAGLLLVGAGLALGRQFG